jgi:hypothetical protein
MTKSNKKSSKDKSTEERLAQLEAALEKANLEIARAQAAVEIQSVMGRYIFYYTAQRYDLIKNLWSKKEDACRDVSTNPVLVNTPSGPRATGRQEQTAGLFHIHALSTPVVAVAADGQTARASWISPGITTEVIDGKASARWCWIKYGGDFIKEDGEWKFWHLTSYGLFHTDYYTSWADMEPKPLKRPAPTCGTAQQGQQTPPQSQIDSSKLIDRNDWTYAKDRLPELDPVPPVDYKTFQDVYPGYRTYRD